ncbi:hypothetical protein BS17DRAFT_80417 [Gyrodon lividus]|nr:hypothetical protein BS17DRAFT_80417 [Gyrodon lividus]
MPSSFAEVWMRVYTKEGIFHGLIQAAYRHILKNLPATGPIEEVKDDDFVPETMASETPDIIKIWMPPSDTPRTPRTPREFSRNPSAGSIGDASTPAAGSSGRVSRPLGRTPSFSENQFTAVPPNFRGESPSRKPRSKRGRDASDATEGPRPRKSMRLSEQAAAAP